VHEFDGSAEETLVLLRARMQATLDDVNNTLRAVGRFRTYPNPFR
jgi:hypothetical protein